MVFQEYCNCEVLLRTLVQGGTVQYCKSIVDSIVKGTVLCTVAVTMDQWRGESLAGGATYLIALF